MEDSEINQETETDSPPGDATRVGAKAGAPLMGLEISTYCRKHNVSTDRVWHEIHAGRLIARHVGGKVLIFGEHMRDLPIFDPPESVAGENDASPVLDAGLIVAQDAAPHFEDLVPSSLEIQAKDTEISLLVEHLNLAKEENREIIRLTQDSIQQITQMSQAMLEMKEEQIGVKSRQIDQLDEKLSSKEREIKKLKQEIEDLQMLNSISLKSDRSSAARPNR